MTENAFQTEGQTRENTVFSNFVRISMDEASERTSNPAGTTGVQQGWFKRSSPGPILPPGE